MQVEKQKEKLDSNVTKEARRAHIFEVASDYFHMADAANLAGDTSKEPQTNFRRAFILFTVLKYFGPLDENTLQKIKYAKHKEIEIHKAVTEGRAPPRGGPNEDSALLEAEVNKYRTNREAETQAETLEDESAQREEASGYPPPPQLPEFQSSPEYVCKSFCFSAKFFHFYAFVTHKWFPPLHDSMWCLSLIHNLFSD